MGDKISQLPQLANGQHVENDDLIPVVVDGVTMRVSRTQLLRNAHFQSGFAAFGDHPVDYYFWNYTYPNGNSYITLNKTTADNDASHVFCQGGRAKWEVGATTEDPGASPRYHIKKVRNPTSNPADDQFIDLFITDYDSETLWVVTKLGIGGVPQEKLHVIQTNVTSGRLIAQLENYNNTGSGSQSTAWVFKGASGGVSWVFGNDLGENGGNNWFISPYNGGISMFGTAHGVAVGGTTVESTEAFRVDSTTGGFLMPRLTTAQRDAMGGKNSGLMIFNITTGTHEYWSGPDAAWKTLGGGTGGTGGTGPTYVAATESSDGLMSAADKTKLNTVAPNANNYVPPSTWPATMIAEDATHRFATDAEKSAWNGKASAADIATASTADRARANHTGTQPASSIDQDTARRFVSDAEIAYWNGKQSPATTLAGYGIGDAMTATAINNALAAKLNSSAVSAYGLTLIDDADAPTARATLGLGTAATTAASAYATAAQGTKADNALPAASVSAYGLTLVDDADAATARATLGLGTAATTAASAYATAAQGTKADNALPSASVSAFGLTLIDDADAATARGTLGLGTAATTAASAYATAAQGAKADTAVQPAALSSYQPLDQQLTDLAALVYTGNAGKVVKVNASGTGWEVSTDLTGSGGGAPAGAAAEVQYRANATTFGAAARTLVDANGDLIGMDATTVATPAVAGGTRFMRNIANRRHGAVISPNGWDYTQQPHIGRNQIVQWIALGTGGTPTAIGMSAPTGLGTGTGTTPSATNRYGRIKRTEYLITVAAAGAVSGLHTGGATNNRWTRGNGSTDGGFFHIFRGGPATGVAGNTAHRFAMGMSANAAAPTDVNPSTIVNSILLGYDSADTQWQIISHNGTGATKAPLGVNFPKPTADRASLLELTLYCAPSDTVVYYQVQDIISGAIVSGTIASIALPAATTFMGPRMYHSAGGANTVSGVSFVAMYIDTEFY